jgi:sulfatase modifying factor 1
MEKTRMTICLAAVCMMVAGSVASADILRGGINMEFVTIGHAGNAADTSTGYGAVSSNYRIGKYEVTNAQWDAFTAPAGAPTGDDGGYWNSSYYTGPQQPTNRTSWYEAAQFCNYLTSGDKSKGAYRFSGDNINPGYFQGIDRIAAQATYGTIYFIPTEDEWYKAAYFKTDGSGYSLYANGTDTGPVAGVNSNYNYVTGSPWDIITHGTPEQNGTFDMMGNVWEWNETQIYGYYRGIRAGSYGCSDYYLGSSHYGYSDPYYEYDTYPFNELGNFAVGPGRCVDSKKIEVSE